MSDPARELDQPQPPDHAGVQAVYQKLVLLTKHNLKIPSFHKYNNTPFSDGDLQPAKIVDHYLTGKELYKEIKKCYGLSGVDLVRQIYSEHLLEGNQSNAAVSLPSQRMIDNILARRSIQRLEKKRQTVKMIKKLNEEKVCLEKMLQELQLEKKSFRHDFKVSPRDMENKRTLQNRIHSTMECLPELEARVQNLREELHREDEKKLRPYIGESLSVAAEPYQLQDMKMVQELLGEMVENLMDDYIIHVPQDIQPECEKDKRVKILEEMSFERAVQLIMEQLVLEVTFEMAKQLGQETFTDKSPTWTLGFDIIFRATEEASNTKKQREKNQDDVQTHFILQQIKVRDHHRKEMWKHTLEEHTKDANVQRIGYIDGGLA
ncbi:uncharacterized protein LOC117878239 [Trachemys scripta elegans]|uniref:uncharacterized protein LOC117878239 n=1 Tax=Trachemys scripta elegans TaxID=31138 RepID=UPI0015552877|nr:uncharacterized protein LOC117878239 [Trachemys scripta elegans]